MLFPRPFLVSQGQGPGTDVKNEEEDSEQQEDKREKEMRRGGNVEARLKVE